MATTDLRIQEIENCVDKGAFQEAFTRIDAVLTLGPQNIHALKLKAFLFGLRGEFKKERALWKKISEIDPFDNAAMEYFFRVFWEEREFEYFTSPTQQGGRRYFANYTGLSGPSLLGLFGCFAFLALSHKTFDYAILKVPSVAFAFFLLLVVLPWLGILLAFLGGVRDLHVDPSGIEVRTRVRRYSLLWEEVEEASIVQLKPFACSRIYLVLRPKSGCEKPGLAIELGETAAIRAVGFVLEDVAARLGGIGYRDGFEPNSEKKYIII
jgi:hypothetical protein